MPSVAEYVDKEYTRLQKKKNTLDDLASAQKRVIILNESYRKRFTRYTHIVMIISFVVFIYLGVFAIRKMFPSIPETATDLFLAVIFFIGAVWCINILREISSRTITNYDELDLPPYVEEIAKPSLK
jgi:hypothetical protein